MNQRMTTRKEGNDHKSIQLPTTFRPRQDALKAATPQSKHYKQKVKEQLAKRLSEINISPGHTCKYIQ